MGGLKIFLGRRYEAPGDHPPERVVPKFFRITPNTVGMGILHFRNFSPMLAIILVDEEGELNAMIRHLVAITEPMEIFANVN